MFDQRRQKVFFFSPYPTISGVSVLFLRMAHALAHHANSNEMELILIDYPNGYMSTRIEDPNIRLESLEPSRAIVIPKDAVFVCQSLPLWRLPREIEFHPDARFLLWHLHPLNIVPSSFLSRVKVPSFSNHTKHLIRTIFYHIQSKQCKRLVATADQDLGLYFMDQETCTVAEQSNRITFACPRFLPLPTIRSMQNHAPHPTFKGAECGWLGRLESFKIPILLYTLQRISQYSSDRGTPVNFHIIGDGKEKDAVVSFCQKLNQNNKLFSCVFYGEIQTAALDQLLSDKLSLLFAMGTSALEGAKVGIPTVLLDFSYDAIHGDYTFRMLPQTTGFVLGRLIRPEHFQQGNKSLENILDRLPDDFQILSKEASAYFETNHSLEAIVMTFISALQNTRFTYGTAKRNRVLELDWIVRLFHKTKSLYNGCGYRIKSAR